MLLISTIGTSLITNQLSDAERQSVLPLANARESELPTEARQVMDKGAALAKAALADADVPRLKRLSAELNGILSFVAEEQVRNSGGPPCHNILVATDTHAGRLAGGLVHEWLVANRYSSDLWIAAGLRTSNLAEFRAALADLAPRLFDVIAGFRGRRGPVAFNLTGGFKGVNGFMHALAAVTQCEAVYVFESGKELMRIPRLPVRLDTEGVVRRNLDLFRRLAAGGPVTEAEVREADLPEALLFLDQARSLLSEWGELVWLEAWRQIASEKLLEPRSAAIRFSDRFRREVAKLSPERTRDVNDAIEALARRLEGRPEGRLESATLKKLGGDPVPPSTHELYAWSGRGAGRIFLHQEGTTWVADSFGEHLG
jgi:putative CRISPR-associated protein (TIGR02619 family)